MLTHNLLCLIQSSNIAYNKTTYGQIIMCVVATTKIKEREKKKRNVSVVLLAIYSYNEANSSDYTAFALV